MKILFISSSHNGLSQRAWCELVAKGHQVEIQLATSDKAMEDTVNTFRPDLILAPFLKKAIPGVIWKNHICLIVHPGIKGDRGPSSLDWVIMRNEKEWGVTILQAAEEMDAGDIWSSHNFKMRPVSKSNLYRHEVTTAAMKGIHDAVANFESGVFLPKQLDYSDPRVTGTWNDSVKRIDRIIDWTSSSREIVRKIKAADSNPGVLEENIFPFPCFMFGAHLEGQLTGKPGRIIAQRDKAVCIGTGDGSVWVSHLKKQSPGEFKLPAMDVLIGHISPLPISKRDVFSEDISIKTFREIWYQEKENVGYLHFDFYNGAMNTQQCQRLREAFWHARTRRNTQIIVLMGGHDIWSNGIHLNTIEYAIDSAEESWNNIIAIDDLVYDIITCDSHYIISALHGNAGAGGVMMALAADEVLAREGIILNPHYKNMGLFGSEYWTYLLPKRVGQNVADRLTTECLPLDSKKGVEIGLLDTASGQNVKEFRAYVKERVAKIQATINFETFFSQKRTDRIKEESKKSLDDYRNTELRNMWDDFNMPDSRYHSLRYNFVHKMEAPKPLRTLRADKHEPVFQEELNIV